MKIQAIILDWGRTLWDNEKEQLFPETKELLSYLKKKGYRIALLSVIGDTPEELKRKRIKEMQLELFFDKMVFCTVKETAEVEEITFLWDLPYENIVVIGDRTKADVRIANKLGMQSIWIQKGRFAGELPNKETGDPTHIISSLEEVRTIL